PQLPDLDQDPGIAEALFLCEAALFLGCGGEFHPKILSDAGVLFDWEDHGVPSSECQDGTEALACHGPNAPPPAMEGESNPAHPRHSGPARLYRARVRRDRGLPSPDPRRLGGL